MEVVFSTPSTLLQYIADYAPPLANLPVRHLHLNIVPLGIPDAALSVGVLPYVDQDTLRNLRQQHAGTHVFKRAKSGATEVVYCLALDGTPCAFASKQTQIPASNNLGLVCALVEEFFVNGFAGQRPVLGYQPLEILTKDSAQDYLRLAAGNVTIPPWLVVRLSHQIEVRTFRFEKQAPFVGLVLNQRTHRCIDRSCADLMRDGLDLQGLYVVEKVARNDSRYDPHLRLVGRVARSDGTNLYLDDFREGQNVVAADAVQPEASAESVYRCLRLLYGPKADVIDEKLFHIQSEARSGPSTWSEITRIASRLGGQQKKLKLLPGFSVSAGELIHERQSGFPTVKTCPPALLVFDPTLAKPATPSKQEIFSSGPYSQRGFSPSRPKICVVCQRARKGEVEQFLHKFFHGVNDPTRRCYFSNGFIKTYRLADFDLRFFLAENASAQAYHKAAQEAFAAVESDDQRWNLALVQVDESSHELHGADNPYLVTKAAFLAQQVPTQEFETETMTVPGSSLDFVLSNMALASYAKLGGTPWHLQVNRPMAHELVIGLGSAYVSESRLGAKQRVVGITTLFTGEGRYMLGNLSKVVPFEEYGAAVTEMLQGALVRTKAEMNWQKGDEVRLVFHSFKPMKDDEAEAVKAVARNLAHDFQVDFAFLHVAQDQPLTLTDTEQRGVKAFGGGVKGALAPTRGTYVTLSRYETLLSLVGPAEVKKAIDGLPGPLILKLHRSSSFADMEYLTKQVFNFSGHSWRSFNAAGMPVTILYSQLPARLAPFAEHFSTANTPRPSFTRCRPWPRRRCSASCSTCLMRTTPSRSSAPSISLMSMVSTRAHTCRAPRGGRTVPSSHF